MDGLDKDGILAEERRQADKAQPPPRLNPPFPYQVETPPLDFFSFPPGPYPPPAGGV